MRCTLLAFMTATVALSAAPLPVISREHPALGRIEGGKSLRYSLRVQAGSFFCLRTDALQASLRITLFDPAGGVVTEIQAPRGLYGAYSLTAISNREGEYVIAVSNDQQPSEWAAYEVRLIELRLADALDTRRYEAEKLLNHALDNAGPAPQESAAEALRACDGVADRPCRARAAFVAGLVYLQGKRFQEADRQMANALEIESDGYVQAAILNWWLLVKRMLGDVSGAWDLASRAVIASERAGSPNLQATAYSRKTTLARFLGRDEGIELDLERTITFAERAGLDSVAAETRTQLASMLLSHGDPRAEAVAKAALGTARKYGIARSEAYALDTLSRVRWRTGDLQGALEYASQATAVYSSVSNPGGQVDNHQLLAGLYSDLGDFNKAAASLERAQTIAHSVHDRDRESTILIDFGNLKTRVGDVQGGLALFRQSLELSRAIPNKLTEASALLAIGSAYNTLHQYEEAEGSYRDALAIHQAMRDSFRQAEVLGRLGGIAATRGNSPAALDFYEKALELRRAVGDKRGAAVSELAIAKALRSEGKLDEAREILGGTLGQVEQQRNRIVAPNLRMTYFGTLQPFYEEYIDLLMLMHRSAPNAGHDRTAFQVSEFARARVLLERLPEIPDAIPSDLATRDRELRQKIQRVAEGGKAGSKANLDLLLADYELLYNQIRSQNPRYAAQKNPPILTTDEVIRQLLDDRTALLEYKICPERSYAWVITKDSTYGAELPGREKLRDLIGRLTKARTGQDTIDADAEYWAAARDVSDAILAPIAEKLSSGRLLLAADDVLQQVSFAGLPWPTGPRDKPVPLVERFLEITSIPSASALAAVRALPRDQPPSKQIAIFADPVFGPNRRQLPGSGAEAQNIAKLVPQAAASLFTRTRANLKTVENAHLEDFRNILFATHAVVDTERPDLSGIVLSEIDSSGHRQNGILTLLDIYALRLRADLVTLSTCESGAGKAIQGEGVIALSRGFLYAGARAVVATMWPIDDVRAVSLVQGLYSRLLGPEKTGAGAALRDSQLALWRKGQSPRRWAAFVIVGDPGPSGKTF